MLRCKIFQNPPYFGLYRVRYSEKIEPYGWYGLSFSAGETNLYLTEFKLLGANLPKSANDYYRAGVEQSVRGYDYVARKNHIPYYGVTHANNKHDNRYNHCQ